MEPKGKELFDSLVKKYHERKEVGTRGVISKHFLSDVIQTHSLLPLQNVVVSERVVLSHEKAVISPDLTYFDKRVD